MFFSRGKRKTRVGSPLACSAVDLGKARDEGGLSELGLGSGDLLRVFALEVRVGSLVNLDGDGDLDALRGGLDGHVGLLDFSGVSLQPMYFLRKRKTRVGSPRFLIRESCSSRGGRSARPSPAEASRSRRRSQQYEYWWER